jgi:hypothetical protein
MLDKLDLITLNNNEEYIVLNITILNDKKYLYLVSKDGISNFKIVSYDDINNKMNIVNDEIIFNQLIEIFKS